MNDFPCRYGSALLLLIAGTAPAWADGYPPQESLKRMKVAEGFELQLFASEPQIRQPVSMSFDHRGRMWVIQYLQYPNPAGLTAVKVDRFLRTVYDKIPEPPPKGPKGVDRITILEDTDGDGRSDRAKDFVTDLNLTTGLAVGHGGVFILQSPYLLFYPDKNNDDVPDGPPEVVLQGFGMEDSHAYANSLQWGPDGWLYGAQGSTVTAKIRDITFQQGIWRYHPLTKEFELFAEGGGNTWGVDFDRHGNLLAGTNFGGVAMLHQVQGGYYVKNFGKHGELQNPYAFGFFDHVPYQGFQGGHVTCGGVVYQGGAFPEKYRQQYIAANLLSNTIDWHIIETNGSTFTNRRGGQLIGTDDTWFRPIDCTVGPDGALYVADWYDRRANHVDPKDDWDKTNGRIYKLVASGSAPPLAFDLSKKTNAELIAMLSARNAWHRREARRLLAERREPGVSPTLFDAVQSAKDDQALEYLWALYVSGGFDETRAAELLNHSEAYVRTWTVRLLGDKRTVSPAIAARLLELARKEPSPTVRSQLASTAKRLPGTQSLPIVAALLTRDEDGSDPFIPLLLWWAIEDKAAADQDRVLEMLADPAAWKRPLVNKFIVERLARRYAAAGSEADFAGCARLLALAPSPADADLLVRGMEKGLEGQKLTQVPRGLEKPLDELWRRATPSPTLVRFALRLGSSEAQTQAAARIANRQTPAAERLTLIEALGQVGQASASAILVKLLDAAEPANIQTASLAALQRFPDPEIAQVVLARYPDMSGDLQTRARGLLTARASWAKSLLEQVDGGKIDPKQIPSEQLQQIAVHNDKELTRLIEKHWGKIQQQSSGEKTARIHGINVSLKMAKGDIAKGKILFTKHCATCHTLFGEGNKVGPELTGADRKNVMFLLSNIVDPSAVIRKEFINYNAELADGRILTGLIAESTPKTVTLLDAKNQKTVLSVDEIETLEPAPLSLMPERILDLIDVQEIRDLFSYLQSDPPKPGQPGK